jgi:tetratricopeptide (TPR) repeat protein
MSAADNPDPGRAALADRAVGPPGPAPRARRDRGKRTSPQAPRKDRVERTADLPQQAIDAHRRGDIDKAERIYRMLLHRDPADAIALNNLGILLVQRGRREAGEALIRKAVAAKPDYAVAHCNLGNLLREKGDIDASVAAFEQAVAAKPDYAEAHFNLALYFAKKGRLDEAVVAFDRAIASKPAYAEAHFHRADALRKKGDLEKAITAYREATALKPDFGDAYAHLGIALAEASELDEAAAAYRRAIELKPENPAAHSNLGNLLIDTGEVDAAIAAYRQAIAISPDLPHAHFGLSLALLQKGEHAEAWREYEWRWKGAVDKIKPRDLPQPQWQGEDLSGKTLLIYAEQGLGDTLQFVRFVPSLAARGGQVVLEVPSRLLALLRMAGVAETMVAAGAALPEFDFHLPLLSLPSVIGLTEESIPAEIPYLAADPARVARWRERLPKGGFRVGIVWQGFPNAAIDKGRSIPLRCFAPLAAVPEVRLISLQKNYGLDQLDALPEGLRVETLGADFDAGPDAFLDTAAVMADLDLIVTSDTSIAHVAGALGRPVWLALKANPDWRWLLEREDSPWYPTARLFRQRKRGDWDEVMGRVAAELARVIAGKTQKLFAPGNMPSDDDRADHARAAFERGFALHRGGSPDAAEAAYCKAVMLDPSHAAAYSNLGVIRHGRGRIDEAITLYRRAVAIKPDHLSALGNLAVALTAKGDFDGAIAALRQAVAVRPDDAWGHLKLGDALRNNGDVDGAVDAYRQAVVLKPDDPKAHFALAVAFQAKGELDSAIGGYQQAIALDPGQAQAHASLGVALVDADRVAEGIAECRQALALRPDSPQYHANLDLALSTISAVGGADAEFRAAVDFHRQGRTEEAITSYRRAIVLKPDHAEAHAHLGAALHQIGELAESVAHYEKALALRPDDAATHYNFAITLKDQGLLAEAVARYERALALKPDYPEAHFNIGNIRMAEGNLAEAAVQYERALALRPDYLRAHVNLGNALRDQDQTDGAIAEFKRVLALAPDHLAAHINLGVALQQKGDVDDAIAEYRKAIALKPDSAGARFDLSLALLLKGDFAEGWSEYEWRWNDSAAKLKLREFGMPQWQGEDVSGKTLLLHAEQGFGDTLQFCRYAPLVGAKARVILEVPGPLVRLCSSLPGVDRIVAAGDPVPAFDLHCPLLSLPHAFSTTLETIPGKVPYLAAQPEQVAAWRQRVGALPGLRVGLVWAGSSFSFKPAGNNMDRRRSITLAHFAPLAAVPGVSFVSLQKGDAAAQTRSSPPGMVIHDWTDELDDFADTAALIEALDLVISVDTSVVHLAGALAKPVWILNRFDTCWRWMLDREDSPWYPTARLFRQPRLGDWDDVFERVAQELARIASGKREEGRPTDLRSAPTDDPVLAPVAVGELADKITILEIKAERIADAAKLRNVRGEMDQLRAVWDRLGVRNAALDALTRELKTINECLWVIEDEIRDCERQQDFGPRFVELARAVYRTNDRRAEIKREINLVAGSAIVEEKSYRYYQPEAATPPDGADQRAAPRGKTRKGRSRSRGLPTESSIQELIGHDIEDQSVVH